MSPGRNRLRRLKPGATLWAAALVLAPLAGSTGATSAGPLSGTARTGCGSGCHGDAGDPDIGVVAPFTTDGGPTPLPIHVSVSHDLAGGGGFMLEASAGRIEVSAESGIRNRGPNEATHDGTQPLLRSWSVEWANDGPVTGCTVDLLVAAMATNADGDSTGDTWGARSAQILLEPAGDIAPPARPVFHAPAPGDVVYSGNRVAVASGRTPVIVVYGSVEFRLEATDDSGVRDVVLHDTDALGPETRIGEAGFDPATGRWALSWDTEGIVPGPHRIRAVATDCAGNVSETTIDLLAF